MENMEKFFVRWTGTNLSGVLKAKNYCMMLTDHEHDRMLRGFDSLPSTIE